MRDGPSGSGKSRCFIDAAWSAHARQYPRLRPGLQTLSASAISRWRHTHIACLPVVQAHPVLTADGERRLPFKLTLRQTAARDQARPALELVGLGDRLGTRRASFRRTRSAWRSRGIAPTGLILGDDRPATSMGRLGPRRSYAARQLDKDFNSPESWSRTIRAHQTLPIAF